MGEVFVAEDTRLNRRVALKVLSDLMAADPERRQRFEREAQAIAALNHPNIVTIHSVEEADGIPFLTMELVEGKPLGEVIPPRGLPVDMVLRVAIAISDAIAAAHQRGITHRDLKPANVIVTPEGRVKVLDFGLAKLQEAELTGQATDVTRVATTELTGEGRIIGTVSYMSPEQAEGKPVDHRTDIFSLGVMLHEMATGERPFKGDTNVSIISSILKDTPSSITDITSALPAGLARVIRKALAKDPSRRYQTAADLRNDLEELKQELDSGVTLLAGAAPARRRTSALAWVGIALAAVLILGAIAFMANRWRQNREERTADGTLQPSQMLRLTSSGNAFLAAVSPDAKYVAHVKSEGTLQGLWLRQAATTSDVQIVPSAPMRFDGVTFSPDGNHVYYVVYDLTGGVGTLFRVAALGGVPQRVVEDVDARISFSPDGQRFAFVRGAPAEQTSYLMVANADGTDVKTVATQGGTEQFVLSSPAWSPDGLTIAVPGQSLEGGPHGVIFAVEAGSGTVVKLPGRWTQVGDLSWLPDGRSLLAVASEYGILAPQLWQVRYPTAEAHRFTSDLNTYASVSVSGDGKAIVAVQTESVSTLWVAPGDGSGQAAQITRGRSRADAIYGLDWTPDGRIVFIAVANGRPQISIIDADGRNERQLTSEAAPSIQPSVTPDSRYILFQRFDQTGANIWRMKIDGSEQNPLTRSGTFMAPRAGSDGFVYMYSPATGSPRPWKVPIEGGEPVLVADQNFRPLEVSRDGSQLLGIAWDVNARRSAAAFLSTADGAIRLIPDIPAFGLTWAPGGALSFWMPEGRGVSIVRLTSDGTPQPIAKIEENLFNLKWSRDGRQMVMARGHTASDVVHITPK